MSVVCSSATLGLWFYIAYTIWRTSGRTSSLKEVFEIAVNIIQSKESHTICFRGLYANNVDPDQTPRFMVSDLGLNYLSLSQK